MTKLLALTDYKNKFGSKHFDVPYRSGFDKGLLTQLFNEHSVDIEFIPYHKVGELRDKTLPIVYTSSEDEGNYYKSFLEDSVLFLEEAGFKVIPGHKILRAHNNKVFMEYHRRNALGTEYNNFKTYYFGTLEELKDSESLGEMEFPIVIKSSSGANAVGVALAKDRNQLIKIANKFSRTKNIRYELYDRLRVLKHKHYIHDSGNRNKFILQEFIPGLKNDWKIYVFGNRYYVFYRPILKGRSFRASGGGYDNYLYGDEAKLPQGILDFARKAYKQLDTPHLSIDIAWDGKRFYLIEYQGLYFGTAGIPYSKGYFIPDKDTWSFIKEDLSIEKVYVDSIIHFLRSNG